MGSVGDGCLTAAVFVVFFFSFSLEVYARTTPAQKTLVVRAFAQQGLSTIMCGDGTNDVGALQVRALVRWPSATAWTDKDKDTRPLSLTRTKTGLLETAAQGHKRVETRKRNQGNRNRNQGNRNRSPDLACRVAKELRHKREKKGGGTGVPGWSLGTWSRGGECV